MAALRGAALTVLLATAGLLFWTHTTGQLFPGVAITSLLVVAAITAATFVSPPTRLGTIVIVSLAAFYGLFLRVRMLTFPASLPAMDPDKNALNIMRVIQAGSIGPLDMGFYESAANFHILGAITTSISGLTPRNSVLFVPVLLAILLPIVAACLAFYLPVDTRRSNQVASIGAVLTTVGAASIEFAYTPIIQAVAVCIVLVCLILLTKAAIGYRRMAVFPGILVLFLGLAFTHKLAFVVLGGIMVGHVGLFFVSRVVNPSWDLHQNIAAIYTFVAIGAVVQYLYITDYFGSIFYKIYSTILQGVVIIPEPPNPAAAVQAFAGLEGLFFRRMYLLAAAFSALPAAYLLLRTVHEERRDTLPIIGAYGMIMTLLAVAVAAPSIAPVNRVLFHVETIALVLIAAGVVIAVHQTEINLRPIAFGFVLVLAATQVGATTFAPDHPEGPRYYLNSEEVAAKEFAHDRIERANADFYLAREVLPSHIANPERGAPVDPTVWPLLNNTMNGTDSMPFVYRDIRVYRMPNGDWRLNYPLKRRLDENSSKVYTSGNASVYR